MDHGGLQSYDLGRREKGLFERVAGVRLSDLPSLDPFADIDPMLETGIDESEAQIQSDSLLEGSKYISESGYEDDESDCEYVDGDDVNDDEADDPFDDESESDDDENEE